jgi:glycosyltransferase involved in cell wall biosynthesis
MEGSTEFRAAAAGRTERPLAVLCVGRLNANKDPLTVLQGFARFAETHPQATLTFVYGASDLEGALRDAVRRTSSASRVTLAGAVPHGTLEAVYAAADIFVLGSRREGSGYAALEAMACGVVPVLTDIPSFRWLTDDGRIGALWDVGDPVSLGDALARVASSDLQAHRRAAKARFDEHFSWSAIGRRAMEIYREFSRT